MYETSCNHLNKIGGSMIDLIYREICESEVERFAEKFGDYVIRFNCLHFGEGCLSLGAFNGDEPVGFISTYPEHLIAPLENETDAYIDVIEVDSNYHRKGIATTLITQTEQWAKTYGYKQIRSWSSDDKEEAIPMWNALNYCLCPAIMHGIDLNPNPDGSLPVGYYVAKILTYNK
jgi:GNAT superfamily N-acetyltransferase